VKALAQTVPATTFLGYGHEIDRRGTSGQGRVLAMLVDGVAGARAEAGAKVAVVLDRTPFYGESGGQTGDTGTLTTAAGARIRVDDAQKPTGGVVFHHGVVEAGAVAAGDEVTAIVDDDRRERIRANHSATHLLNHALKRVLGDHVAQKGSLVEADRLRFDFAHFSPMTAAQKRQVEDLVNAEIRRNDDSIVETLPIDQARARGAVAMFGEKYGAEVRVVQIGHESLELCGGTHVRRAGDIGLFKILSEAGVAQGVRRIEAVTGAGALAYVRQLEEELGKTGERLRAGPLEVADRVEKLQASYRSLEKELDKLKQRLASGAGGRDLMSEVVDIGGVKVLAAATEVDDPKVLRDTGDQLRDKLGSGVVLLAGVAGDKVALVAMVTRDLSARLPAGKLVGVAAEVLGGRGGGKADLAQGAGKDPTKVPAALTAVRTWIAEQQR
jgi:alanyl-tRNA synthetase